MPNRVQQTMPIFQIAWLPATTGTSANKLLQAQVKEDNARMIWIQEIIARERQRQRFSWLRQAQSLWKCTTNGTC